MENKNKKYIEITVKDTEIGLAIAKAIMDAYVGTISAESKVGEGSEFIVSVLKE